MRTAKTSEKRDKSITEFIMVVILLGVLMKVFIGYFFSQEQSISNAAFKTLGQGFKNTVVVVHAQWLMDSQPDVVLLSSTNEDKRLAVTVNRRGWIDQIDSTSVVSSFNTCEAIWQLAMNRPMVSMKLAIAAIEIHQDNLSNFHRCRYIISSGEYFEYYTDTGQVTHVSTL